MKTKKKKSMIAINELLKWLLALLVLAILIFTIVILSGKGSSAVDYIKNLFRFGK